MGIRFAGGDRVLNNYVHHIGALGLTGSGDHALVDGNEVAFNNAADYRTIAGGCWTAGGSKWVLTNHFENNHYLAPTVEGTWWTWQGRLRTWSEWRSYGHDTTGTLQSVARCR